jgi:hypothetical protein
MTTGIANSILTWLKQSRYVTYSIKYIRLRSIFHLHDYLKDNGYRSKRRTTTAGRNIGGAVLSRDALSATQRSSGPEEYDGVKKLSEEQLERFLWDSLKEIDRKAKSDTSDRE